MGTRIYVAETHWCRERLAVQELTKQGFTALYPMILHRREMRNQLVDILKPCFPNYVFVALDLDRDRWRAVNGTRGVRGLFGGYTPIPLPVREANDLMQRCNEGPMTIDEFADFALGASVEIKDGPLAGKRGTVSEYQAAGRIAVLLAMLGREVTVSVHKDALAAVG